MPYESNNLNIYTFVKKSRQYFYFLHIACGFICNYEVTGTYNVKLVKNSKF